MKITLVVTTSLLVMSCNVLAKRHPKSRNNIDDKEIDIHENKAPLMVDTSHTNDIMTSHTARQACGNRNKNCKKYKGECIEECSASQRLIKNGCKNGGDCVCCAKACERQDSCIETGGACVSKKKQCISGQILKKGCKGKHCYCCVPKACGNKNKNCKKYKGKCIKECSPSQRLIKNGCTNGGDCVCCAKACERQDSCIEAGGACVSKKKQCISGRILENGCKGKYCFCCVPEECPSVPCDISEVCSAGNGFVASECGPQDWEISDPSCHLKCCVPMTNSSASDCVDMMFDEFTAITLQLQKTLVLLENIETLENQIGIAESVACELNQTMQELRLLLDQIPVLHDYAMDINTSDMNETVTCALQTASLVSQGIQDANIKLNITETSIAQRSMQMRAWWIPIVVAVVVIIIKEIIDRMDDDFEDRCKPRHQNLPNGVYCSVDGCRLNEIKSTTYCAGWDRQCRSCEPRPTTTTASTPSTSPIPPSTPSSTSPSTTSPSTSTSPSTTLPSTSPSTRSTSPSTSTPSTSISPSTSTQSTTPSASTSPSPPTLTPSTSTQASSTSPSTTLPSKSPSPQSTSPSTSTPSTSISPSTSSPSTSTQSTTPSAPTSPSPPKSTQPSTSSPSTSATSPETSPGPTSRLSRTAKIIG